MTGPKIFLLNFQKIEEISERDFTNDSCYMMVFLSHGKRDKVLMKKGQLHIQDDILNNFRGDKCPSLSGKPKIFLFQVTLDQKLKESTTLMHLMSKQLPIYSLNLIINTYLFLLIN